MAAGAFASGAAHHIARGGREIEAGSRRSVLGAPLRPGLALPLIVALLGRASEAQPRPWSFLPHDEAALVDGFRAILFEGAYVDASADLVRARDAGLLLSGFAHWLTFGRRELVEGRRALIAAPAPACPVAASRALRALVEAVGDWSALLQGCTDGVLRDGTLVAHGDLRGRIDELHHEGLRGWAWDADRPGEPVILSILVDGEVVGRVVANQHRDDLVREGVGAGRHGFEHVFRPPLSHLRHVVALCREADEAPLPDGPVPLPGTDSFDGPVREAIAEALGAATTEAGLRDRISFVAGELERLLGRRAEKLSGRTERLAALRFRRRWIDPAAPDAPAPLAPRALVIDARMPDPGRDAGSAALLSHALSLRRLGYEVVFAAADMSGEGAAALDALGIGCCHAPWFGSMEEVLWRQSHGFDLVYLHRVGSVLPYLALVRRHQPRARVIYGVADLHHLRLARQAAIEDRPELAEQARTMRGQEFLAASGVDAVITHSPVEAAMLQEAVPASRIHVIPWAVQAAPGAARFAARSGFGFVGHFGHAPNVDAALWLLEEVLPLLRARAPEITGHLVGSAMPDLLSAPRPGVVVHGRVADLGAFLGGVRLTVAPLQYGAGIKGKVLDSLAAGVPCLCTSVAIEGLPLGPALRSLVADDAAGFAANIHRLHTDPALHRACRREGLAYVSRELAPARVDSLMEAAIAGPRSL